MRILLAIFMIFSANAFASARLNIMDGQKLYWSQAFGSRAEAESWLAIERTRPYWKSKFTITLTDNDAEEKAKDDALKAADKAAADLKKEKRDRMKAIDWSKVKTFEDLKPIIKDLVDDKD